MTPCGLRLRSDVPVGAHLSGGLDSSAVVAAAARHGGAEIHTFTGAFLDDDASDERAYSRAVNKMYDLTAHEIEITVDDLPRSFARILWHMDEPIAGEGVFPQLMVCDLAAQHGFTVVLGGQGGDELFGGYLRHRALHYKRILSNGSSVEREWCVPRADEAGGRRVAACHALVNARVRRPASAELPGIDRPRAAGRGAAGRAFRLPARAT